MPRRSSSTRRSSSGRVLHLRSSDDEHLMDSLFRRGPVTFVLVYSTSCPHCHTYMPTWKRLCAMRNKRANMVSMEADTYMGTQMSKKMPVDGVPSVIYVSSDGSISEVSSPRDTETMSTAVERGISEEDAKRMNRKPTPYPSTPTSPTPTPVASSNLTSSSPSSSPSATMSEDTLRPLVATPVGAQTGGSPWAAFLLAAQQAAPAAALLGVYSAMKKPVRSSGLGNPIRRRTRRTRR
jgi:hypothetical protein